MNPLNIAKIAGKVGDKAAKVIDEFNTTEEEKMKAKAKLEKIKNEVTKEEIKSQAKEMQAKKEIIKQEAKGGWLQRNWRPIFMLVVIVIIANNYIIAPYVPFAEVLELPTKLWNVIMIGLGGYLGDGIAGKLSPNHDSTKRD